MKKYGSLVPLSEKEVLGRLKDVFNEDFSNRYINDAKVKPLKIKLLAYMTFLLIYRKKKMLSSKLRSTHFFMFSFKIFLFQKTIYQ